MCNPRERVLGLADVSRIAQKPRVDEGAQSFTVDSTRERTPLGHNHRARIRDLSVERIREMYREAATRFVERTAETREFFQAGSIAIVVTSISTPF